MADDEDLDDLLSEVSSALSGAGARPAPAPAGGAPSRAPAPAAPAPAPPAPAEGAPGRCLYVCLGAAAAAPGTTRSLAARASCAAPRCTACDCAVLAFRGGAGAAAGGVAWTRDVDYLFLRNEYPAAARLAARLAPAPGGAAYACQCAWVSVLPADGAAPLCVRRPGNVVTPATAAAAAAAGAEPAPPLAAGRVGGAGWANWVCAGHA